MILHSSKVLVARLLVNSPFVQSYVKYTATTVGRDKAYRFIQYFSRLLAYVLMRGGFRKEAITTAKTIQAVMTQTRKVLRLGRFIDALSMAAKTLTSKGDCVVRTLTALNRLAMAVYFATDTVGLLRVLNVIKRGNPNTISRRAQKAWLAAIVCSWLAGLYQLIPLHFKESLVYRAHSALGRERDAASAHSETEKSMVSRQLCAVKRQLVQDTLDMTIPLSALGLVNFNEGVVALAGTITSFMGGQAHFYKLFI